MTISLLKEKPAAKAKSKPLLKIPNAETLRTIREVEAGINLKRVTSIDDFFKEFHQNENN
jgi:antitoxin component of RelBE/YafQ-DinJ toxin-antitoxin module